MRLFGYYALHSFKNQLKKLFKSWVIIFILACAVIGGLIGFGMGKATAIIAAEHPHINYIGIEVHKPGVGKLLSEIEERGLQNLRIIEQELSVKVLDRDDKIHVLGEAENVMLAEKAINGLLTLAARGESIDAQNVRYILKLVSEGKETKIQELAGDVICITAKGKPIKPKTIGQTAYVDAIKQNTVTLGV